MDLADISRMYKAVCIYNGVCLFLVPEVALECVLTSEANLALRKGLASFVHVSGSVVHFGHVYKLNLTVLHRAADMSGNVVGGE